MVQYQYDTLLEQHLGKMGLYQYLLATICSLDSFTYAFYALLPVFISSTPPHKCAPPVPPGINCTLEEYHNWAVPLTCTPEGVCSQDPCRMYTINASTPISNCSEGLTLNGSSLAQTEACTSWSFGESFYSDNVVKEWDLVCNNTVHANTVSGVYMLGMLIGCTFVGSVADAVGRRKTVLVLTIFVFICAVSSALVQNFYTFLAFRFLLAVFDIGRSNVAYVLGLECLHSSYRTFFIGYTCIFWTLGWILLTFLAYYIHHWRYLHLVCAVPEILILIIDYMCLPESPRWLLLRERKTEVRSFIEKMAKVNKRTLPKDWELESEEAQSQKASIIDLVKAPYLRLLTMILAYIFFANSFVYYGLALNTAALAGNEYLNFLISGALELPSYVFISFFYERVARRPPFCVCLLAGGIMLLSTLLVPKDLGWVVVVLAMAGKFFITTSFGIVWLVAAEVFPTVVRGIGLGATNSAARVASFLSAYVGLLVTVHESLPIVIFSISAIIAGGLVILLPETRGIVLPQKVLEGEAFIKENMCKIGFCSKKRAIDLEVEIPMQDTKEASIIMTERYVLKHTGTAL